MRRKENNIQFNLLTKSEELKQHAVKSAAITMFAQITGYLVQMIGTFWIARLVIPSDFGLVTMVTVFSLLLQNLGENGFTEYVLQKDKLDHQQVSNLFWLNCGFNTCLAVSFILFAPIIAWCYHEPRLYHISIAMSLCIVLGALPVQHLALLKRNMSFFRTSMNEVTSGLLSTVIAIAFAKAGFGYWAIVIRRVAMPFFMAIGGWVLCPWIPGLPKKSEDTYSILRFVFDTYGNFTVTYVSRNLDKLLIGKYYGVSSLGYYDRAYHLAMLLPNQLAGSLSSVSITTLSKLKDDKKRYKRNYKKILSIITFVAIPLSITLALTGQELVILLLGAQWETAGEIFRYFAPSIGLMIIHATSGWVHLSLGRADRWFKWGIVRVICASISIIIGLFWGPKGVAAAYSIYMTITLIPALLYAGKPIGVNLSFLLTILWKYMIAGVFSVVFCQFILMIFEEYIVIFKNCNPITSILILSISCIFSYCSFNIFLFRGIEPFNLALELFQEPFRKSEK